MNIWMFNNYNTTPEHGHFNRVYNFSKNLKKMGHTSYAFVGSHPHNTNIQLIEGKEKFVIDKNQPFPWVLVKTCNYEGSIKKQLFSMIQYYYNGKKAAKYCAKESKPDVILGSSFHPLAPLLAIRLAKKYKCKSIVEVRDLWPESVVSEGVFSKNNIIIKMLYCFEKYLYKKADAVVFTMEGAYDYIVDQKWDKQIPRDKVYHINNGVDIEAFDYNKDNYNYNDEDLNDEAVFKVVYTGSVRFANNFGKIIDAAHFLKERNIKILVWGAGGDVEPLRKRVLEENLNNVVFKGAVEKKFIPSILSQADVNMVHWEMVSVLKYGISYNKLFDYLAAGKPIFSTIQTPYSIILPNECGISAKDYSSKSIADGIIQLYEMEKDKRTKMGENARKTSKKYEFGELTQQLVEMVEEINKNK